MPAGTFTMESGGSSSLNSKSVDFMYTSKNPGQLFMASTDGVSSTLYSFINNDISRAQVSQTFNNVNPGGFYWNTIKCNGDTMNCIDGTDRLWHHRYTFTTRIPNGFYKNPGFLQSSASSPQTWFRMKKVPGKDYAIAASQDFNSAFASGTNKIARTNFAVVESLIVEFEYTAAANVVDISVFKKETDQHFLVVSDNGGATYHYDVYDHTSTNPSAIHTHTVTPSPVSDDTRPRCIDLIWNGEDSMIRVNNDGTFSLSTGYLTLTNIVESFSYKIADAAEANEVMWIPQTNLAVIGTHNGKAIFTSTNSD